MSERLKQALDAFDAATRDHGCTDGYCIIYKPKGMHTNGGCRCNTNAREMQRFGHAVRAFREAIEKASTLRAHDAAEVTDEMVEAALEAFNAPTTGMHVNTTKGMTAEKLRRAIQAALAVRDRR